MNLSETARLLSMIAAFNNRTIGEADVVAWQSVLSDVDLPDAEEAVRRHYAEHTEWLMPAHVRRIGRDILRERFLAAQSTGWAPGQAGVPKDQAMPEVSTGERLALSDLPAAVAALVARVRADLPEGSREALMPRRVAWEREHRAFVRTRDAEPNPLYKPNPHKAPLADDSGAYFPADPMYRPKLKVNCVPVPDPVTGEPIHAYGCAGHLERCDLCGDDSGNLAQHVADYPNGSCV